MWGLGLTEFPSGLHKCELLVVHKEGDGAPQELWLGLEVSIEDGHIVTRLYIGMPHALFQSAGLVSLPVVTHFVPDVDAFTGPTLDLHLHQILQESIMVAEQSVSG